MNGVMNASVSLGSSQRAASVTWTPQVSVPSEAAGARPARAASASTVTKATRPERTKNDLMAPPSIPFEPHLFQWRRPRIRVDQEQRGLGHARPDPARPDVFPKGAEPHP